MNDALDSAARPPGDTSRPVALCLSLAIVAVNTVCSVLAPVSIFVNDTLLILDGVWRLVQGQSPGVDFYNPLGFGVFVLGSFLWQVLDVRAASLPLAIGLFAAAISTCAWVVACWGNRFGSGPARLLFCALVAFVASAPFVYGYPTSAIGTSAFYNRLGVAALGVVFVQAFVPPRSRDNRQILRDIATMSCLLAVLFLVKISFFFAGAVAVVAGLPAQRRAIRAIASDLLGTAIVFVALLALVFALAGLDPRAVLSEYRLAASARPLLGYREALIAMFDWPVLLSAGILLLCGLYDDGVRAQRFGSVLWLVLCYFLCQLALNLTNNQPPTVLLAPIAGLILWAWSEALPSGPTLPQGRFPRPTIAVSGAIFLTGLTLFQQGVGTARAAWGIARDYRNLPPKVVTLGGNGMAVKTRAFAGDPRSTIDYVATIEDGLLLLRQHRLAGAPIQTMDYANPFPVLLLAPSPKNTALWWHQGVNMPARPVAWPSVLGTACVVMVPMTPEHPGHRDQMLQAARQQLDSAFRLTAADNDWQIYSRIEPCAEHPKK